MRTQPSLSPPKIFNNRPVPLKTNISKKIYFNKDKIGLNRV